MAIARNYKDYKEIFLKYNLDLPDSKKTLGKIKIYEIISKVIFNFSLSAIGLLLYSVSKNKSNNEAGLAAVLSVIAIIIVGGSFWALFLLLKSKNKAKLDEILFTTFLIKKIKIFFSIEELNDKTYDKIEHIAVKVANARNPNQTTIELAFLAFLKNAEGIVVVSNNQASVTTGTIGKTGGYVGTNIINSAEAILINNIQDKKHEMTKDLEYWFGMLQKGAITEEEYGEKKMELLS